mgnify:FL=1
MAEFILEKSHYICGEGCMRLKFKPPGSDLGLNMDGGY